MPIRQEELIKTKRHEVGVFRTSPQTLEKDIERSLSTSAFQEIDPKLTTYIKINGNFDFFYPGSNTSEWFLDALLKILREKGFNHLKVIEGDLPDFKAEQMIHRTRLIKILEEHKVPFLPYENLPRDEHELPLFLRGSQLINLPVFHTHGYAVISCATKNLFGLLPKTRRKYHKILSGKLLEITNYIKTFTIVDGTVGLVGESTRRGNPRRLDLILTGWDPLSIDDVVARIMGYQTFDIPLLSLAKERNKLREDKINLYGDFHWNNLPKFDFTFKISPYRRVLQTLDCSRTGDFPPIVWVLTKLRRVFHYYNFFAKHKQLFNGPWMEYENVWKGKVKGKDVKDRYALSHYIFLRCFCLIGRNN